MKQSAVGTWVSEPHDSVWGMVIVQYCFREDGVALVSLNSADPDEAEDHVTPDRVHYTEDGNRIVVIMGEDADDIVEGEVRGDELVLWNRNQPDKQTVLKRSCEIGVTH